MNLRFIRRTINANYINILYYLEQWFLTRGLGTPWAYQTQIWLIKTFVALRVTQKKCLRGKQLWEKKKTGRLLSKSFRNVSNVGKEAAGVGNDILV